MCGFCNFSDDWEEFEAEFKDTPDPSTTAIAKVSGVLFDMDGTLLGESSFGSAVLNELS